MGKAPFAAPMLGEVAPTPTPLNAPILSSGLAPFAAPMTGTAPATTQQYQEWHGKTMSEPPKTSYWDALKAIAGQGPAGNNMLALANSLADIIAKDPEHPTQQMISLMAKEAKMGAEAAMFVPPIAGAAAGFRGATFGKGALEALTALRPAAMGANVLGRTAWAAGEGAAMGAGLGALDVIGDQKPLSHIGTEAAGWAAGGAVGHALLGEAIPAAWKAGTKWAYVDRGKVTLPEWGSTKAQVLTPRPMELPGLTQEAMATNQVISAARKLGLVEPKGVRWDDVKDFWNLMPTAKAATFEEMGAAEKLDLAKMLRVYAEGKNPKTMWDPNAKWESYPLFNTEHTLEAAKVNAMQGMLGGNPAATNRGTESFKNFLGTVGKSFRRWSDKFGSAGKFMADMFDSAQQRAIIHSSPWVNAMEDAFHGMSKNELLNLTDVIQKDALPMSDKVSHAYAVWQPISAEIAESAKRLGVMVKDGDIWREFAPIKNHFPRRWTMSSIDALSVEERTRMFENAQKPGEKPIKDARDFLERMYSESGMQDARSGGLADVVSSNLQRSRTVDMPGYEKDAREAIIPYLMKVGQALSATEHFGPRLEVLDGLLKNVGDATGKGLVVDSFKDVARKVVGGWSDPSWNDIYNLTSRFEILTKLGFPATLKHFPGQFLNGWVKSGTLNQFASMGALFEKDPELMKLLRNSGVDLKSIRAQLMYADDVAQVGKFGRGLNWASDKYMGIIGLNSGVAVQRTNAAMAGILRARDLTNQLAKLLPKSGGALSAEATKIASALEDLGLNSTKIIARGGALLPEEASAAGLRFAMDTQLMSRYGDMPVSAHSPLGKFFNLFKSASFQQAVYDKNIIWKPLIQYIDSGGAKGDAAPAIRWMVRTGTMTPVIGGLIEAARGQKDGPQQAATSAAVGAVLGPGADAAVDVLGGGIKEAPAPDHKNVLLNLIARANADGQLGLWADILESTKSADQLGNTAMGPIINDAMQGGYAGIKSFQDVSLNPLAKYAVKHVPMVGRSWAKDMK